MISRIRGSLVQVDGQEVCIEVGPVWYDVIVPTSVLHRLPPLGNEVVLYLYAYIDGGQMGGAMHQRLIGFLDRVERDFFELLITVGGLGARRAARAMALPVSRMASAIERGDERTLRSLPEIGPSTAKKVIAHLQGKAARFALLRDTSFADPTSAPASKKGGKAKKAASVNDSSEPSVVPHDHEAVDDALQVLTDLLHYADREALELVQRALQVQPNPASSDALLQTIFQLSGPPR